VAVSLFLHVDHYVVVDLVVVELVVVLVDLVVVELVVVDLVVVDLVVAGMLVRLTMMVRGCGSVLARRSLCDVFACRRVSLCEPSE